MKAAKMLTAASLLGIGINAGAATMDELAGAWTATAFTRLSIAGIGSLRYSPAVECTFVASDDISGRFYCLQDNYGTVAAGATKLISGGNLLSWMLDVDGVDAIENAIGGTLTKVVTQSGGELMSGTIEFDIRSLTMTPIKIEANRPTKGTLTIKGYVAGDIGGRHYRKPFNYTTTVKFSDPAP